MSKKTLHPSIEKFKEFVKNHPKLINEVRLEKKSWQELYEDWYLLGEDDGIWKPYKDGNELKEEKKEKSDFMSTIFSAVKGMDLNQVQQHMSSFGEAITNIQQLIGQFKGTEKQTSSTKQNNQPFFFNKD
ncbi:YlbD family protein [Bacillus sp. DJP31]|uniref:YlbD family protein n=1 Tax=Bacillus sp. DJP31 TaxID=3409789 RepID=UPI003BB65540